MMATKEQERKALEKIRKIVAELGEGSYIATAFEGCFDIAEENIDNDFACSMKSRVDALKKENAHLKDSLNALHSTIDDLNKENKELKKKVLPTTEAEAIKSILNQAQLEAAHIASEAANKIVEAAGCEVYGYIDYNRKLSEDEINHYELIPGGLTTYWVVITSVYDTGRVTCNIAARERHARKPDHYHTSTQRKDIYIDYFESQEEAEQFVSESRKA